MEDAHLTESPPLDDLARAAQDVAVQYAAAVVMVVVVLMLFFPGNEFVPAPWHEDDFINLSSHLDYHRHDPITVFCTRPVAVNAIAYLAAAGDTTYFVVMLLLTASLPLLAVRLALRLFRRPSGPALSLWLVAAVAFCTFLYEESLWFYRYTGLMTNLLSVAFGMAACLSFSRWFDGNRWAFPLGCALFLGAAFAKEDMLLFVPLYGAVDWCIGRLSSSEGADRRKLLVLLGSCAAVIAATFLWNNAIVHSRHTTSTETAYQLNLTLSHVFEQLRYYVATPGTPRVLFSSLALAALAGVMAPGHRIASLSILPLVISLILPYSILPRTFSYYCVNWLSIGFAFVLVGIAALPRFETGRWPSAIRWVASAAVLAAMLLSCRSTIVFRSCLAAFLNERQHNNRYIIDQVVRHREEFANADTVVLRGIDNVHSPWWLSGGFYINAKLGRSVRWIVVARPDSSLVSEMKGRWIQPGPVSVVSERQLAAFPDATTLVFDDRLNLTVHPPENQDPAGRHAERRTLP